MRNIVELLNEAQSYNEKDIVTNYTVGADYNNTIGIIFGKPFKYDDKATQKKSYKLAKEYGSFNGYDIEDLMEEDSSFDYDAYYCYFMPCDGANEFACYLLDTGGVVILK